MDAGGESVALLSRYGRRFASVVRVASFGPIALIGVLGAGDYTARTVLVVAGAGAWSAVYVWWLLRRTGLWVTAVDAAVLVLVCLSALWTDAAAEGNTRLIRLLVSFACMAYQWYTPLAFGAAVTGVSTGTLLVVVLVTEPTLDVVTAAVWVLIVATLSRTAWTLVMRGARSADRLALDAARARKAQRVDAAVRAEERRLVNALHDTAATTLLMVGSGQVRADDGWLAPRARRDLDMLRAYGERVPAEADLVRLLREETQTVSQLPVRLTAPPELPVPYQVGRAVADAAREAMNNVIRHADASRVQVRLTGDRRRVRLDVVDDGRGFVPERVPATRRGLRDCVRGRLSEVGGMARVASSPGGGTIVSLEWCDE